MSLKKLIYAVSSVMLSSTSTPGLILMLVISLSSWVVQTKSITLLKILISHLSQVFVPNRGGQIPIHQTGISIPFPQGDFLVPIRRILVGILTGPWTLTPSIPLALPIISLETLWSVMRGLEGYEVTFFNALEVLAGKSQSNSGLSLLLLSFGLVLSVHLLLIFDFL